MPAMFVLTKGAFLPTQLIAANPFTNRGAHYLTEKLCSEDSHLRVLDVHNSEMSPDFESSVRLKPLIVFIATSFLSLARPRPQFSTLLSSHNTDGQHAASTLATAPARLSLWPKESSTCSLGPAHSTSDEHMHGRDPQSWSGPARPLLTLPPSPRPFCTPSCVFCSSPRPFRCVGVWCWSWAKY